MCSNNIYLNRWVYKKENGKNLFKFSHIKKNFWLKWNKFSSNVFIYLWKRNKWNGKAQRMMKWMGTNKKNIYVDMYQLFQEVFIISSIFLYFFRCCSFHHSFVFLPMPSANVYCVYSVHVKMIVFFLPFTLIYLNIMVLTVCFTETTTAHYGPIRTNDIKRKENNTIFSMANIPYENRGVGVSIVDVGMRFFLHFSFIFFK